MSDFIDISAIEADQGPKMQDILNGCIIDLDKPIPPPPIALSIGTHTFRQQVYPTHFGTYGNFSAIVGASKSKKTFLKSALLAGFIGGKAQNYFQDIKGHQTAGKYVLDLDTEQSKWDVQRVAKRTIEMVGAKYENYKAYALREIAAKHRLEFVEYLAREAFPGQIGIMSIDGVADLVQNTNDLEESNKAVQKLMEITSETNCHIISIIHLNYGSDKPRGHLGSEVLRKCETVAVVRSVGPTAEVTCKHSRSRPFDDFAFRVNEMGLPEADENTQTPF